MVDLHIGNSETGNLSVPVNILRAPSITITRPSDTNIYAAGDVIEDSTSAPTNFHFSNCVRYAGGSGTIVRAVLVDSQNNLTLKGQFELWLFDGVYAADNDNAVFTPTDTEMLTVVSEPILFNTSYVGDATSGAGGNAIYGSGPLNIPFRSTATGANARKLGAALVVRNAYTPVSAEVFTVILYILWD